MLRRLSKEEIVQRWNTIKLAIERSLPPIASGKDTRMQQIYNNLMLGTVQCWGSYRDIEKEDTLNGIGTTTIVYDFTSGAKMLLGYTAFAVGEIREEDWIDGYQQLVDFAIEHGCENICAYTANPRIFEIGKQFGATGAMFLVSPALIQSVSKLEKKKEE
jgi:hypothetical protein